MFLFVNLSGGGDSSFLEEPQRLFVFTGAVVLGGVCPLAKGFARTDLLGFWACFALG